MRSVLRPDVGSSLEQHRKLFPKKIARIVQTLEETPTTAAQVDGTYSDASEVLAAASWLAKDAQLLLDTARLHGQACVAYAALASAGAGLEVAVRLGGKTLRMQLKAPVEAPDVTKWISGWFAALTARDDRTLDGLAAIPDSLHRRARVQVDEYQYVWKRALYEARVDPQKSLSTIAEARAKWNERKIASKAAANIDACAFDVLETLIHADAKAFNDALYQGLVAHTKLWTRGDERLSPYGWVALKFLGLACVAYDRGIPIEVESDYLPEALITRLFTSDLSLGLSTATNDAPGTASRATDSQSDSAARSPQAADLRHQAADLKHQAARATREIALRAGEGFGRVELEPHGYRLIPLERKPFHSFDFVYVKDPDEVTLVDTRAGDEPLLVFESPTGATLEQGSRGYLQAVVDNMRSEHPELAARIATGLKQSKLRYFEARYPIDEAGKLGEIEFRQYAL